VEGVSINIPVKGPGNIFDINVRWQRILPSFGNFSWDMHRVPPNPNIKVVYRDISGGAKVSGRLRMRFWK
jgi:hypothetical protein